jgi:hypothetical protein
VRLTKANANGVLHDRSDALRDDRALRGQAHDVLRSERRGGTPDGGTVRRRDGHKYPGCPSRDPNGWLSMMMLCAPHPKGNYILYFLKEVSYYSETCIGSHDCHALPLAPSNFLRRFPKQLGNPGVSSLAERTTMPGLSIQGANHYPHGRLLSLQRLPRNLYRPNRDHLRTLMFRYTSGSTPCTCLSRPERASPPCSWPRKSA